MWLKDYHVLLNAIQSLQNDNNMLRRRMMDGGKAAPVSQLVKPDGSPFSPREACAFYYGRCLDDAYVEKTSWDDWASRRQACGKVWEDCVAPLIDNDVLEYQKQNDGL